MTYAVIFHIARKNLESTVVDVLPYYLLYTLFEAFESSSRSLDVLRLILAGIADEYHVCVVRS